MFSETFLNALTEYINSHISQMKSIADGIKSAATGTVAADLEKDFPSITGFLGKVATDAGFASSALAMVPQIEGAIAGLEAVIGVAQALGAKPADWNSPVRQWQDENSKTGG